MGKVSSHLNESVQEIFRLIQILPKTYLDSLPVVMGMGMGF